MGGREGYRSAIGAQGGARCFKNLDELQPFLPTGCGLGSSYDAIDEMLRKSAQWLLLVKMRNVAVPVMVRILKFRKTIVMGRPLDSDVVNANLFKRLQVIINDHAAGADDRHLAHFPRFQPTTLNGRETLLPERKRHIGNIFDP